MRLPASCFIWKGAEELRSTESRGSLNSDDERTEIRRQSGREEMRENTYDIRSIAPKVLHPLR
jgi:hypothetical protein